jgi:hypothetical protein
MKRTPEPDRDAILAAVTIALVWAVFLISDYVVLTAG